MTPLLMFALPLLSAAAPTESPSPQARTADIPKLGEGWYVGNYRPLTPSPFLKLPFGAVKPKGWLRKQLELEADGFVGRLGEISGFLKRDGNSWLSPDGKGHSPWEELPYWLKGFGDLGYVLGDKRVVDEARVWLEAAIKSQRPDGYFGPEANLTNAAGKPDLWPNMLMLNALQSYYEYCGDKRVIDLMTRYFKWEAAIPEADFLTAAGPGYWQNQRGGDNLQSVFWLYNHTKEPWLLDLADKIHRCTADWSKGVANWHGVNFAQSFREPGTYFQQAKKVELLKASENDLKEMRKLYGQVPGGCYGADENARPGYSDPRQATETCSFVELMWSDELLYRISGDGKWADHCEDVAYNSLPASMTADLKALRYLTSPNMVQSDRRSKSPGLQNGGPMLHFNPHEHRCCQHNVAQGWPFFAEHLWMATPDKGLAAVFYAACDVTAKVGDGRQVTVKTETRYPFEEHVRMTISAKQAVKFPMYLRVPGWCSSPKLTLNGKAVKIVGEPLGLVVIERTWKEGDKLVLTLPMAVTFTRWTENAGSVSVNRGPLTYSLKIAERLVKEGGTDQWPAWEIYPDSPWNYGLAASLLKPGNVEIVQKAWPADDQPFKWDASPIELRLKAKRIPAWKQDHLGLVGLLHQSPVKSDAPLEKIDLIPMGCARLRIASFPTVGGAGAKVWPEQKNPTPAKASWDNGTDPVTALSDGVLPKKSGDVTIPRFTWWDHTGSVEWVEYEFPELKTLSGVAVYWFDDTGRGKCRVPASWTLQYMEGDEWKPVPNPSAYGRELDRFNEVSFGPIATRRLRIQVQLQDGFSAGILEWQVK